MTTVGVTGHQYLNDSSAWEWVRDAIKLIVHDVEPPLLGVTSLAVGADQIFAQVVVDVGGSLSAVIPFPDYPNTFHKPDREIFDRLLKKSINTVVMGCTANQEECYLAAGKTVINMSAFVVAVWDGMPAQGLGGTADIVNYALQLKKRVVQLNPLNKTISEI